MAATCNVKYDEALGFFLPSGSSRPRRRPSVSTRLSQPNESRRIDKLRHEIPVPKYAIPEVAKLRFPKLEQRLLESKFPHLEPMKDVLYYTRGRLGHEVLTQDGLRYKVEDEYNLSSVLKMSSYDPLHDQHLEHYLSRPVIKTFLTKQGFLRDDDRVVCSLSRFNEFRKCSGVAQNERLAELLRKKAEIDVERHKNLNEMKALGGWQAGPPKRSSKDVLAKRKLHDELVRHRLTEMFRRREVKREQAERTKMEMMEEKQECSVCQENMRRVAYDKAKLPRIDERRNIIVNILRREEKTEFNPLFDKILSRKFRNFRDMHRVQGKVNEQNQKLGLVKKVQDTFDKQLKGRAKRFEQRMAKKWRDLPKVIAARRAEQARLLYLAGKYFYRWLNKVRERRQRRIDAGTGHLSQWNVTDTLEKCNDNICEERIKIVDIQTLIMAAKHQIEVENALSEQAEREKEDENRVIVKESLSQVEAEPTSTTLDRQRFLSIKVKKKKKKN